MPGAERLMLTDASAVTEVAFAADVTESLAHGRVAQLSGGKGVFRSTKTYDHSEGLSCCFRQWRAESHCRLLHGYALAFRFVFATRELDRCNWCFDFGGLKSVRAWLHDVFDHTTIVAEDDPQIARFKELESAGLSKVRFLPAVGCEATAAYVFAYVAAFIRQQTCDRVWLESAEVREHGGNSAIFMASEASFPS